MSEQERIDKLKELINRIADSYAEPSEDEVREMRELTGIDWPPEDIRMICFEYWESPYSLEEIVYYLMHEDWPEK